jgi:hypothetical protein
MIRLLWAISPRIRDFLARWAPTNRLLAAIRTRRGLKWGVPAMALGGVYFLLAAALVAVIRDGGPAWLNAVVLLAMWNGFKFIWIGPVVRHEALVVEGGERPSLLAVVAAG